MNPYLIAPRILRETSDGISAHTLQDAMFEHREIECIGEINEASVNSLILQLRYLHRKSPTEEITIYINSPGGSISDGLALVDINEAYQMPHPHSLRRYSRIYGSLAIRVWRPEGHASPCTCNDT